MRVYSKLFLITILCVTPRAAFCAGIACKSIKVGWSGESPNSQAVLWDSVLKRKWQVHTDCQHPDWPPNAIEFPQDSEAGETKKNLSAGGPVMPLHEVSAATVRAGSNVDLWRESPVRIRLSGIALEKGEVGDTIRVLIRVSGKIAWGSVTGVGSVQLTFEPQTRGQR